MEAQVLKSLAKLRKACTRSHRELRDVIDAAQAKVSAAAERGGGSAGGGGVSGGVEVPFEPFLLACLTRHAKLMAIALDCIEKFLAFGFLRGNGAIPEGIRKRLVQKSGVTATPRSLRSSAFASLVGVGSSNSSSSSGSTMTGGSSSSLSNGGGGGTDGGADFETGSGGGSGGGGNGNLNDENWKLIDCIVDVICECNDHPDETVQIQVLRVLLTAVTTTTCEVHEHSLLKAVRACYHIHLVSRNATNQMVAKATLQQIISIVFQRMETFDQRVEQETAATLKDALEKSAAEASAAAATQQPPAQEERAHDGTGSSRVSTASDMEAASSTTTTLVADADTALYPDVASVLGLSVIRGASVVPSSAADAAADEEEPQPSAPPQPQPQRQKKQQQSPDSATPPMFAPSFPSVLHKDAFLLFRSLCRISMRSVAEDSPLAGGSGYLTSGGTAGSGNAATDDPFAFQSKILSLELVLSIINNAGPSFRRGERFIHAIRQYLCQSLLQNCTSNYTQIVGLSLQVFLVLINNFKRHLKAEIDIFVTSIFLRILQSENSSFEHKMLVLEVLNNLCDDASILGEIFLNYDCDWNTNDLFRQIIDALAKIAKGKKEATAAQYANMSSTMRLKTQQNDSALVLKGLECLTATVASLKKAANFVEMEKKATGTGARTSSGTAQPRQLDSLGDNDDEGSTPTATSPSPSAPPAPSTSSAMSAVEAFDRKKKRQEELANGILKFNAKPSAGIQYLVQHGHMGQGTPRDVARFLHEHNDKLDKTEVGDYLGKEQQYQGGFCVKVLHEYVDMMDFTSMEIDVAIRHFLAGFRLPGESQKIDRMMEKFAERYYSTCPPGLFPSADTAFILAFSIIMLQTDLHNPSIPEEKKMDKAGFLRNNRGINNGEDLPEEYMGGIFDRIKQSPISLKEDEDFKARRRVGGGVKAVAATTIFGTSIAAADRQRRDAYIKERETMVRQSEALFKRRNPAGYSARNVAGGGGSSNPAVLLPPSGDEGDGRASTAAPAPTSPSSTFHLVTDFSETSFVRPMFETVWAPLLASCSVIFESSDAPVAIQLCLNSFKHAIHLAARLGMPAERDAFVTVLAKFTALHTTASRVLRAKNIEAIKALISISVKEGNYLGDSWHDSLLCISQLARVQTHAQGLHSETQFFNYQSSPHGAGSAAGTPTAALTSNGSRRGLSSSSGSILSPSPSHRESVSGGAGMSGDDAYSSAVEDENAARVLAEIDSLASDRVFSSSVTLSDAALQEFVQQLCVVSLTECSGAVSNGGRVLPPGASGRGEGFLTAPRVFSLQKLVEVADMNMNTRSRVVWASTWRVLSRHFTAIGCDENLSIAMYAIDSLRQLSMKFLEREELKDFNFQRLFLEPFEIIMSNATSLEIRELVLRCVENMILARVTNIKSGWKTIWGVLRVAAETYEPGDADQQDKIVRLGFLIARRVLDSHFDRIVEVFVDAVECLLAFAVCGSDELERALPESLALTKLSVDCIAILEGVCMDKLASGQVIEKLFVEASAAKRVGFKRRGSVTTGLEDAESTRAGTAAATAAAVAAAAAAAPRAPRAAVRYEKQESSRTLEEEVSALSPAPSPRRKSSALSPSSTSGADASASAVYTDSPSHTRMWWPVLTALATLAADRRVDVRLAALRALFDSLERHGDKFSPGLWALVFKGVLIPLLDELRHVELVVERGARAAPKLPLPAPAPGARVQFQAGQATSTYCLQRLLDCFGLFYDAVGFLPEVLFLLGKCMDSGDAEEELAAAAAAALEQMLVAHGHKFPEDVWGLIADELRSVMARAEPSWVLLAGAAAVAEPPASPSSPQSPQSPRLPAVIALYPGVVAALGFRFPRGLPAKAPAEEPPPGARRFPSRARLAVVLALQRVLGRVLASRLDARLALREGHVASLTACLRESFQLARRVNDAVELRLQLQRAGWAYGKADASDLPSLLPQEVEGKRQFLRVLLALVRAPPAAVAPAARQDARRAMARLLEQTLHEFLAWTVPPDARALALPRVAVPVDAAQRAARYAPLLESALGELAALDAPEMTRHLSWLFPLLAELTKTPSAAVRAALAAVLRRAVQPLLPTA